METNHSGGYSDKEDKRLQKQPGNTEALVQTGAIVTEQLLSDIRALIEQARERMAQTVNAELVILNWHIGERIRKDVLTQERAEYGKQIVATLSRQLTNEYGKGFTHAALFRMIQLVERFPDIKSVTALSQHLSWSHFVELLVMEDSLKRDFLPEFLLQNAVWPFRLFWQNDKYIDGIADRSFWHLNFYLVSW